MFNIYIEEMSIRMWYLLCVFAWNIISLASKVGLLLLSQIVKYLLIFYALGFTGCKFHSSSLQRLSFQQGLAGNTIAQRRCIFLRGKPRLIMIKCCGFHESSGQTLRCSNSKVPLNRCMSLIKLQAQNQSTVTDNCVLLLQKRLIHLTAASWCARLRWDFCLYSCNTAGLSHQYWILDSVWFLPSLH